ncbi:MAG: nucleotidyltransferase domain-containing protein [Rhizomicrobium sp.]
MNTAAPARIRKDPILAEIKRRLTELYGDRLRRVVLFGSRARGDHRADSDYDIAIFLDGYDGSMDEIYRLSDLGFEYLTKRKIDLSLKPFAAGDWDVDTHFMRHLHRDAIDI